MHCAKQSLACTECSPIFDTAFSSAVYCAAGTHRKTAVYIDGTLANFSMHLTGIFWLAGYSATVLLLKNAICIDGTLAICFETTFGMLLRFHPRRRSHDELLRILIQKVPFWVHFKVILRSKMVSWPYSELLGSIWDQSGIQGPHVKVHHLESTLFGTFLNQFSTSVRICMKIYEILHANLSRCSQADF